VSAISRKICRFAVVAQHQTHVVAQAISEDRINQVALGLIQAANCVALRHGAVAQPSKLREDEPHPVGLLTSRRQFFDDLTTHRILGHTKRTRSGSVIQMPLIVEAAVGRLSIFVPPLRRALKSGRRLIVAYRLRAIESSIGRWAAIA
jgi:hypothetical protein